MMKVKCVTSYDHKINIVSLQRAINQTLFVWHWLYKQTTQCVSQNNSRGEMFRPSTHSSDTRTAKWTIFIYSQWYVQYRLIYTSLRYKSLPLVPPEKNKDVSYKLLILLFHYLLLFFQFNLLSKLLQFSALGFLFIFLPQVPISLNPFSLQKMSDSLCETMTETLSEATHWGNGSDNRIKQAVVVLTRLPDYKISALRPPTPLQFYSEDESLSSSDSDMQWEPGDDSDSDNSVSNNKLNTVKSEATRAHAASTSSNNNGKLSNVTTTTHRWKHTLILSLTWSHTHEDNFPQGLKWCPPQALTLKQRSVLTCQRKRSKWTWWYWPGGGPWRGSGGK